RVQPRARRRSRPRQADSRHVPLTAPPTCSAILGTSSPSDAGVVIEHLDAAAPPTGPRSVPGGPDEGGGAAATGGLAGGAVIDFGAGTGQFAVPTARRFGRVIAIDVSPAMVAGLRLAASGPAGPPARV